MKKIIVLFFLFSFLIIKLHATVWNVNTSDFVFTPANLPNVFVGDTIKWVWISGMHHTTTSATIPGGAAAWDAPLHSSSTTFSYVVTVPGNYSYVCTPHQPSMAGTFIANVVGITPIGTEVPAKFSLSQNYPNPFNPVTDIKFDIAKSSFVKLTVMNILGQEVETLVNEQMTAGSYKYDWNASALPSGIYFYMLEADGFVDTKKMMLIK